MSFSLTSPAFVDGQPIPYRYTSEGENLSPPLHWSDPPAGTRSLALLCEDPDAPRGIFCHWVIFNLPPESRELGEGVPPREVLPNGTAQGTNDFGKRGYAGPAPPRDERHRYVFTLFALDQMLDLRGAVRREDLLSASQGHILAEARLIGTFARGQSREIAEDPQVKKAQQDRASIYTAPLS